MNVSKEIKKAEAINRMKEFGLFAPCIKAFKRGEVQLSEQTGGLYEFSSDKELTAKVAEFEEKNNALVYHVIHTPAMIDGEAMDMYNFLYVSDYQEEYEMDNADIKEGYVLAYVWNKTIDYFSEFGSIAVKGCFGGLVRIG
jgi:hypothetical protein